MSPVSHLYSQKPHLVPSLTALGEAALGDLRRDPKRLQEKVPMRVGRRGPHWVRALKGRNSEVWGFLMES